jgi:hypothetical protein
MTQSCRFEGARENLQVPPTERADAQHRRRREGGPWGKQGFPHATEPKAREAA